MAGTTFRSCALCVLLIFCVGRTADATAYSVGGSAGWDVSADLGSWLAGKTFYVGDVLVFQYSKYQTVEEVSGADYNNCSTSNPLMVRSDGNTTVPLTAPGDRYFISGNEMYCLGGMKLPVHISPPAGAPAVAPPSSAPTTPSASAPAPPSDTDDGSLSSLFSRSQRLPLSHVLVTWFCTVTALLL